VAEARDREQLGHALQEPEDDRLEVGQHGAVRLAATSVL
jgi:hypothetical protein